MNAQRLLELADFVENFVDDRHFDMIDYFRPLTKKGPRSEPPPEGLHPNECGTAACLAGWTVFVFATPEERQRLRERAEAMFRDPLTKPRGSDVHETAAGLLGLSEAEADYLFFGRWSSVGTHSRDRVDAARALREMAREGATGAGAP